MCVKEQINQPLKPGFLFLLSNLNQNMYKTAQKQACKGFIKETLDSFKGTFIDFNGMN